MAEVVSRRRSDSSDFPCTSCSSWTVNSTSRSPPRPSLIWRCSSVGGDVLGDPAAHGLHGFDETLPARRGPDQRRDGVLVAGAQLGVAGDGPGLQQGLEFPALGPAGVVALVRGQRPDQRPGLALRPQVGVHFPQAGFAGRGHDGPRDARGQGRADGVGPGVLQLAGFDHVDDVDVGNVVQFAGAALAHADHGQRRRRRPRRR